MEMKIEVTDRIRVAVDIDETMSPHEFKTISMLVSGIIKSSERIQQFNGGLKKIRKKEINGKQTNGKYDAKVLEKIRQLKKQGLSHEEIAGLVKMERKTVDYIIYQVLVRKK